MLLSQMPHFILTPHCGRDLIWCVIKKDTFHENQNMSWNTQPMTPQASKWHFFVGVWCNDLQKREHVNNFTKFLYLSIKQILLKLDRLFTCVLNGWELNYWYDYCCTCSKWQLLKWSNYRSLLVFRLLTRGTHVPNTKYCWQTLLVRHYFLYYTFQVMYHNTVRTELCKDA